MEKHETLASEIIREQAEVIEEQIIFYEELRRALLADAARIKVKIKKLKALLDIDEESQNDS